MLSSNFLATPQVKGYRIGERQFQSLWLRAARTYLYTRDPRAESDKNLILAARSHGLPLHAAITIKVRNATTDLSPYSPYSEEDESSGQLYYLDNCGGVGEAITVDFKTFLERFDGGKVAGRF